MRLSQSHHLVVKLVKPYLSIRLLCASTGSASGCFHPFETASFLIVKTLQKELPLKKDN